MSHLPYRIGIIGAGLRGSMVMGARATDLAKESSLRVCGVCDLSKKRAEESVQLLSALYQRNEIQQEIKVFENYKELIDSDEIDIVWITTSTNFHREPAVYALKSGKKVYLDKPISVSLEDSKEILKAEAEYQNPLIMGFTRRYERSWRKAYELLKEGAIGKLQLMQIRSVIPYTRYFHLWHRLNSRSGGAFNDKCSHHFDAFNWFAESPCKSISAVGGRSALFPEDPEAPERCSDCERDCAYNIFEDPDFKEMGLKKLPESFEKATEEEFMFDTCVYKPGSDIYDHMLCHLEYENGVKASLFFCIYGPHTEDQETLELVGDQGRMILTRGTGLIDLVTDYGKKKEVIDTRDDEFSSSHYGADLELIRDIEKFVSGGTPIASAKDGDESLRMIHAAVQSVKEKKHILLEEKIHEQFL
ncbi:MAG: Gfo/Idh/MocA family protein [Bacteriovoracaceae bacterium]